MLRGVPANLSVLEFTGGTVVLKCVVPSGFPQTELTWTKLVRFGFLLFSLTVESQIIGA